MWACRFCSVLRRRSLPTMLVTAVMITVSVNSYLRLHATANISNDNAPGNITVYTKDIGEKSTIQPKRKPQDHRKFSDLWQYHSDSDELFERANILEKSNVLIIDNLVDSKAPSNYHSRLKSAVTINSEVRNNTTGVLSLVEEGKWRSWPECLCSEAPGVECSPLTEPAGARQMEQGAGGACSWRAWQHSTRRVISVALYGRPTRHNESLHELISGAPQHFPGWSVWIYLRHPKPRQLCPLLKSAPHVFFCDARVLPAMGDLKKTTPLLWKVAPLGDERVETLFVRNLDHSPLQREAAAVQEWLISDKVWHVMRDHPQQKLMVSNGLWGARWNYHTHHKMAALKHIMFLRAVTSLTNLQASKFVQGVLWPHMSRKRSVMQHDAYRCNETLDGAHRPWPTRRFANSFVGPGISNDRLPDCPEMCRPKDHKDWLKC